MCARLSPLLLDKLYDQHLLPYTGVINVEEFITVFIVIIL